jgi:hypothetical protein
MGQTTARFAPCKKERPVASASFALVASRVRDVARAPAPPAPVRPRTRASLQHPFKAPTRFAGAFPLAV